MEPSTAPGEPSTAQGILQYTDETHARPQAASAEKAALAVANKLNMQALPIRQYLVQ
jgi:hypothetical protein